MEGLCNFYNTKADRFQHSSFNDSNDLNISEVWIRRDTKVNCLRNTKLANVELETWLSSHSDSTLVDQENFHVLRIV
jgi:hypothetical protein